jgi:sarcosine oxidase
LTKKFYDAIVVGVGSMGAPTCYQLASQGLKVLGLEQFSIVNNRGSHAGQSRIIRKAYFEHPDYVPLLERAYHNWRAIEDETGQSLFFTPGVLYMGESTDEVLQGVTRSAKQYNIQLEHLDNQILKQRFPQFLVPENFGGILETDAGFLLPERSIQTFANAALQKGAELNEYEKVLEWNRLGTSIVVKTEKEIYETERLIFTAGPWTSSVLKSLGSRLKVTSQLLAWIKTPVDKIKFQMGEMPCWFISDKEGGSYYGFPDVSGADIPGPSGIKLARHYPGRIVSPDDEFKQADEKEIIRLKRFSKAFMPDAGENITEIKNCLYTNSPDEDFIIDFVPDTNQQVIVACGFSGHGFKFAAVVGEILSEMAVQGGSDLPVKFLDLSRFK